MSRTTRAVSCIGRIRRLIQDCVRCCRAVIRISFRVSSFPSNRPDRDRSRALTFGDGRGFKFGNDVVERVGFGADRAREREAAERAEADDFLALDLAGKQLEARILGEDQHAVALYDGALLGKIERNDRDLFRLDVAPDVDLGPVGQREGTDALALADHAVIDVPEFRALIARIPAMIGRAEGVDALLGTACLLVAARAAECGVVLTRVERLAQRFGLHDVGIERRSVRERRGRSRLSRRIGVGDEVEIVSAAISSANRSSRGTSSRIDMQEREGDAAGIEGLAARCSRTDESFAIE